MYKPATFAERLLALMDERGLTRTDVANVCGINKSNITRYCRGEYEAKQDVVYKMAQSLNVNAAWLMGYDVSKAGELGEDEQANLRELAQEAVEEQRLLKLWRLADARDKETIWNILGRYDEVSTEKRVSAG